MGMRKLGSDRRKQGETGNVSPQLSRQDMRMDDVGHSGETDHERNGYKNCRKLTHNGIDDGNAKMPMALLAF
jgi:hypothetical protein